MNAKMMRAIRVFTRTVELGRMGAAAEDLHMTTSAVSQQLQKLESDLGLSLFNRNTRNLVLTEAGKIQYQCCRTMLEVAEKAREDIEQLQGTPCGTLKVIAPVGFGAGLLSEPLKQLTREFPRLRLDLSFGDENPDLIAAGADLALCIGPLADSTLVARHLVDWHFVLCAAPGHAQLAKPIERPEDLSGDGYIAHTVRERRFNDRLTHHLTGEALPLPRPRIRVNNMQVAIQLVQDGVGYGLLPEPEVREALRSGRLIQLLPQWRAPSFSVHALAPSRDTMPAKTRAVIDSLQQWFDGISLKAAPHGCPTPPDSTLG